MSRCVLTRRAALAILSSGPAFALGGRAEAAADRNAIEAAVRGIGGSADLQRFYRAGDWRPVWSAPRRAALGNVLGGAVRHGLQAQALTNLGREGGSPAEQEVSLSSMAMTYAGALAGGVVDPAKVNTIYTLPRNRVDVPQGLALALAEGRLPEWFAALAPNDAEYRALSQAYVNYHGAIPAGAGAAAPVPDGAALRPGAQDPRVIDIRAELVRLDRLSPGAGGGQGAALYDHELEAAIRRLQSDFGLVVDGVVGPETVRALNAGPADWARQAALNMERWRWLERPAPPRRIDVNTAAAVLTYYRDGQSVWTTRVVVGRPDKQTPSLGAPLWRLVANPPWRVPASIARSEILPKGLAYLQRHHMQVRDGVVVQRPGPDAALGLVKFDLRNRYAIYLHDTPAKALFEDEDRHRSHGCVRVQDAVGFARRLAEEQGVAEQFDRALNSGATQAVDLGAEIPVRLLYRTAYVDGGRVKFAPDDYDRDEKLAEALGLPAAKRARRRRYAEVPLGP